MSGYDLIAFDMDGTLLTSKNKVSESSREAIARAVELGKRIAVCTGRAVGEIEPYEENELQNVKNAYVGKQGALSMLMKEMPKLDAALRPEMGKVLNQAKNQVTELINSKRTELKLKASEVSPDFDCLYRESCRRTEDFIRSHKCAMT